MAVPPLFWKTLAPTIAFLLIVVSLAVAWKAFNLPSAVELVPVAKIYFDRFGRIAVFFGALGEGIFLVGLYLPGTFVILLGILFAAGNFAAVAQVWAITVAGLVCAYSADYAMGRYGWYKLLAAYGLSESLEKARAKLAARGASAIFTSFWQINIASVTATAAGTLRFSYGRFIICAAAAAAIWMAFWVTIIVSLGPSALELVDLRFIVFALILWLTWLTLATWFRARHSTHAGKAETESSSLPNRIEK